MKKKILSFMCAICAMFAFVACSDSGSFNIYTPDQAVIDAFTKQYPTAQNVSWIIKNGYNVAMFYMNTPDYATTPTPTAPILIKSKTSSQLVPYEAWFGANASWAKTDIKINYALLPQAVKDSIAKSDFSTWAVDDVFYRLKPTPIDPVFIIEVEKENMPDMLLFYTVDGIFLDAVLGEEWDEAPEVIPTKISDFITTKYGSSAKIYDFEKEDFGYEALVYSENKTYEIMFNNSYDWLFSIYPISYISLPADVKTAFEASDYKTWEIEDVYMFENPNHSELYVIEVDNGSIEKMLFYNASGVIVNPSESPII